MTHYSGQMLAYLGDSVYETELRHQVLARGVRSTEKLHTLVSNLTSGKAQAWAFSIIKDDLTTEEMTWFKKGRNAPLSKKSRKYSQEEAHQSSGFEAVFGGLFLRKQPERIASLCAFILSTKMQQNLSN